MPLASALPLLTTFVVVAVLSTALALTWITLRQVALETARERVDRGTRQLKVLVDNSLRAARGRYAPVAHDPLVRRVLRPEARMDAGQEAEVRAALERVILPGDSLRQVELWSADGRRVAALGADTTPPRPVRTGEVPPPREALAERFGLGSIPPDDSVHVGTLSNCEGRACYWSVMPVVENGRAIGYLAQYRRLAMNPNAERAIRELSGGSMRLYYRNVDNGFWTSVFGMLAEPPEVRAAGRFRPGAGELLYAEHPITGAPFVLVGEVPLANVMAPSRVALRRLIMLSLVLTGVGAGVAWLLGLRLARPLVLLTEAAEHVAGGHFDARVPSSGTAEMASLASSFNRMTSEVGASLAAVEAASRAKSDFLATMSHELRTPLNAIGGYVELMEMELRGPITDLQRHDLARVRQSQEHLLSLINAVLDLNRFERGQVTYDLATLPVDPFLAGLDALVAPQAGAKALTLDYERCDRSLAVVADREKLRQVLLNLLSNAIRYTPAGGRISLGAVAHGELAVRIWVRDSGPGIPDERQEEIFAPFVQLDRSLTQSREGVGLGLAISRDLARGMGGELLVESRPGEGARFIVELPSGAIADAVTLLTTAEIVAASARSGAPELRR